MPSYKLTNENGVFRDDGIYIPNDKGNRDWNEYQEWLQKGNVPDPPAPTPTVEPLPNVLILGINNMSVGDKQKFFEFIKEGLGNR